MAQVPGSSRLGATEEFDATGKLTKRTTRTTTSHRPAWQAYAWLLERRHLERWARTERPAAADGAGTLDPEEVIARGLPLIPFPLFFSLALPCLIPCLESGFHVFDFLNREA